MSDGEHSKAVRDKILPTIHKKINSAYMPCNELKTEQLELEKLTKIYSSKRSQASKKINELVQKRKIVEKRKQEESERIASIIEQTKKKIEKIQVRNDNFKNFQSESKDPAKSLEESVEFLKERKGLYSQHLKAHKPCKGLITEVTKLWPTVITEIELLRRLETLIKQKVRFSDEYKGMNQRHEAERKKLIYKDEDTDMIILCNRLDELDQERKDVNEGIQKEEETFHCMMDTSSEVEVALSEVRLGCLRLYNITKPRVKTMDSFEQLTAVLEFGQVLRSVSEAVEKPLKT